MASIKGGLSPFVEKFVPMPEQQLPADYWTTAKVMKEIFETKLCLAKSHSPDDCDGKIIAAHTIPRSQLRKIATDGHVYAVRANAADLARNEGKMKANKIGIGNFSVLNSFCASHDNSIFAPLEDIALVFNSHQLTLLHYRTVASELYRKVMSYQAISHQIEEQLKKRPKNKSAIELLSATAGGQELGIRDIGTAFVRSATDLSGGNYDNVSALVVHFKKLPSVMTVGGFIPMYDYHGEPSQLIHDYDTIAQTISFNILSSEDHAALAMMWFKDHELVKPFAESFIAQKPELYATLAIQTAFEFLENTSMQPAWWDAQPAVVQNLLLERMRSGGSPFDERKANCLTYCGVTFDEWEYDRHEFINVD